MLILGIAGSFLLSCGGSHEAAPSEAGPPDGLEPISASLAELIPAWNAAVDRVGQSSWSINDPPPVDDAGGFSLEIDDNLYLDGLLDPGTDGIVVLTVSVAPSESSSGNGSIGRTATDSRQNDGPHVGDCAATDGQSSAGSPELGEHDDRSRPTDPVAFDAPATIDAVTALVEATSTAEPARVIDCLEVQRATQLAPAEAEGEVVETSAAERTFSLQRFPASIFVSVAAEEP